jgi:CBS domain-containing protein
MDAAAKPLFDLTAADLMSEVVAVLREWTPLREAAEELFRAGVHGAPVVDAGGRCVGVLSVSDLARWAVRRQGPPPGRPRTCSHQEPDRGAGGEEGTAGTWPPGTCPLQSSRDLPDGRAVRACREPDGVCLDWQMVETEALPTEDVRHHMTAGPLTVEPDAPIREIARRMLDAGVRRVIVTDSAGGPLGVVSVTDLVAALAGDGENLAGRGR